MLLNLVRMQSQVWETLLMTVQVMNEDRCPAFYHRKASYLPTVYSVLQHVLPAE